MYENFVQAYVKAFFDYDPQEDDQIPCKEIGLPFKAGDILQIISKDDGKWWQARRVYDPSRIGLIPSQSLEENRRASAGDAKKSSIQIYFINSQNTQIISSSFFYQFSTRKCIL